MTYVAILGCGPAGLMAAHAVVQSGNPCTIFSRKQKSQLFGAQYLHKPIPGMTDRDHFTEVDYIMRGDPGKYRRKVYGPMWDGTVSPEDLAEQHTAWDIRGTYDLLWDTYSDAIEDFHIDPAGVHDLFESKRFQLIINTIPLQALCHQGHQFAATQVVAAGDAPALGIDVGTLYHCPPDTVICNGEDSPAWYRLSRIFDHTTIEWPTGMKPPVGTASQVLKPLRNNCDCWPGLMKVGRYGSWEKGVLSHSAYDKVMERMGNASAQEATTSDSDVPTL